MRQRDGLTVEDCIAAICATATGPRRAREAGLAEDTDAQRALEIAHSNACVFILMALGYDMHEIREMLQR